MAQKLEQLAVNIGQMGTIEPKFVRTPRQDGEKAISIPIETQNIRPTTRETREFMNRSRNTDINENVQKAEAHNSLNCKEAEIKDINDNPKDDTHNHNFDQNFINKCVDRLLENYSNTYNRRDLEGIVLKYIEEKGNEGLLEEQFYEKLDKYVGEKENNIKIYRKILNKQK